MIVKKIGIFLFCLFPFFSVGCMPADSYKQKYPQPETHLALGIPETFSESEKGMVDHTEPIAVNSSAPVNDNQKFQRKPISQTMKWMGQEDASSGVRVVKRKQ